MVFSSSVFLFVFLPTTLIGYWLLRKNIVMQNVWLLLMSIFFYAWGEPSFVFVILLSSAINWLIGERMKQSDDDHSRKMLLVLSVILNLGIFIIFKYLGFIINNLEIVLGTTLPNPHIRLPIGISFFSFQVMSYQIDIYREKSKEKTTLRDFMLYALMFPQLVAGPIVRFSDIAVKVKDREGISPKYSHGVCRFVRGLSKKVLLADQLAVISDNAYFILDQGTASAATAWLGAIAYYLQLYYDFSGYSDMAIGLGEIFGFQFPENFDYPYISSSVKEFWRRWHMTLSKWFRDYVYIPLGGSRKGKTRTMMNLFIIWSLTGLWHGAGWNYLVWGIGYFIVMTIEKGVMKHVNIPKPIGHIYTLVITISLQVIFHSLKLTSGLYYIRCMYGGAPLFDDNSVKLITAAGFIPVIAVLLCYPWKGVVLKLADKAGIADTGRKTAYGVMVLALFILCMSMCVTSSYSPFIYFNF